MLYWSGFLKYLAGIFIIIFLKLNICIIIKKFLFLYFFYLINTKHFAVVVLSTDNTLYVNGI